VVVVMKLLLFSFFLKREEEEDKEEEEETLEMIALPLCLLRFVRVRALAVVVALLGGIDDDDNIFYLHSLCFVFVSPSFGVKERDSFFRVNTRDLKFSFFVSLRFSLSLLVSHHHKKCSSLSLFSFVLVSFFRVWEERRTLSLTA
jgi:hypothetical protein